LQNISLAPLGQRQGHDPIWMRTRSIGDEIDNAMAFWLLRNHCEFWTVLTVRPKRRLRPTGRRLSSPASPQTVHFAARPDLPAAAKARLVIGKRNAAGEGIYQGWAPRAPDRSAGQTGSTAMA